MKKNESTRDKIDDNIDNHSALLLTQYSSKASQLIKSFTKNILFLILILFVITGMTILDLSMDLGFINVLSDEKIDDYNRYIPISYCIYYFNSKASVSITKHIREMVKPF